MLNTAPRHEDMWGGGKAPYILQLQHSMEVRGQLRSIVTFLTYIIYTNRMHLFVN